MEEYSYTSTHRLGHPGPVTGSLYPYLSLLFVFHILKKNIELGVFRNWSLRIILEIKGDEMPVLVVARSKAVCGRSPAEVLGTNPTGGMDVCLL